MSKAAIFSLFLLLSMNTIAQSEKETFKNPSEFNDALVILSADVTKRINQLTALKFETGPLLFHHEVSELNKASIKRLRNMTPVEGGERFHQAIVNLHEFYQKELNTNWKSAMELLAKADEDTPESEINRIIELIGRYLEQEITYLDECEEAQQEFADKYLMKLDREVPD